MNSIHKLIKYVAIAFGAFLCVTIITAIISAITGIFGVGLSLSNIFNSNTKELIEYHEDFSEINIEDIKNLDIKIDVSKLEILESNRFEISCNNVTEDFYCKVEASTLVIKDTNNKHFWGDNTPEITIYLPKNYKFDSIYLETGASKTNIETIYADSLKIKSGVGSTILKSIYSDNISIETGVGEFRINDFESKDLHVSCGVGDVELNGTLNGNADIDSGVGNLEIKLSGNEDNYTVTSNNGIGKVSLNNKALHDNSKYGNGDYHIKIDAGIGRVDINIK